MKVIEITKEKPEPKTVSKKNLIKYTNLQEDRLREKEGGKERENK